MSLFESFAGTDALTLKIVPQEVFVARRGDGMVGSGTVADPYNGGLVGGVEKFDSVMSTIAAGISSAYKVTVRLGPGVFITQGGQIGASSSNWPKSGMKIVGSGINATTIKLSPSITAGNAYVAIYTPVGTPISDFEIAELTIDCDFGSIRGFSPPIAVAVGGVYVAGTSLAVRGIRVKNHGDSLVSAFEAMAAIKLFVGDDAALGGSVVEDCIVDSPVMGSTRSYDGIRIGRLNSSSQSLCFVRRNWISFMLPASAGDDYYDISAITGSGTTYTASVPVLSGSSSPIVAITGVLTGGMYSQELNGTFAAVVAGTQFTFTATAGQAASGQMFTGRIPSRRTRLYSLTASGSTTVIVTHAPHYLKLDDWIAISGTGSSTLDGLQNITTLNSNKSFTVDTPIGVPSNPFTGYAGVAYNGIVIESVTVCEVVDNKIFFCEKAVAEVSSSTATAPGELLVSDNYFMEVLIGVFVGDLGASPSAAKITIQNNFVELGESIDNYNPSCGVSVNSGVTASNRKIGRVLISGNVVRHVNDVPEWNNPTVTPAQPLTLGITCENITNLVITNNLLNTELSSRAMVVTSPVASFYHFNNKTASGVALAAKFDGATNEDLMYSRENGILTL